MLVFEQKIVTRFFRIKVFIQQGSRKLVRFPYNAIITRVENDANLTFSRSDILKTTTVTPLFYYNFWWRALKSTMQGSMNKIMCHVNYSHIQYCIRCAYNMRSASYTIYCVVNEHLKSHNIY